MKSLLPCAALLMLCQCESTTVAPDRRPSLTDSGLSPAERVQVEKDRPLSTDPTNPLNKVHAADGAAGFKLMEF